MCVHNDLWPIQGVSLPHVECSRDRLQIHGDPDQDKVVLKKNGIEEEWINEHFVTSDVI